MSGGVDLEQFYETFFEEAAELLDEMEEALLGLDTDQPDNDLLNGIFRVAHSIKGGAATFGSFPYLANTTHRLENILDALRRDELQLRKDMIDLFLETKDVLSEQLAAYRAGEEPNEAAYNHITHQLEQLAHEQEGQLLTRSGSGAGQTVSPQPNPSDKPEATTSSPQTQSSDTHETSTTENTSNLRIHLSGLKASEVDALHAEMALLGDILHYEKSENHLIVWLTTTATADELEAVACFIVNPNQVVVDQQPVPGTAASLSNGQETTASASKQVSADSPALSSGAQESLGDTKQIATQQAAASAEQQAPAPEQQAAQKTTQSQSPAAGQCEPSRAQLSSTTLRVGVDRVDQIINLVGELVITQAMLAQTASTLDPVEHDRLLNGIEILERNARDLQETVMSIRMMPMDYVFRRFPRVVRESASRMGKKINLITEGQATELDKSLIEQIIDPLTHLVRNSLDHGIELPEERLAAGKEEIGKLTLSAQHSGGHIVIEVIDDGAGLDRDKILAKAIQQGFAVNENTPDDELWQLIFAPGFSTAKEVTEISGRGVGMDVVRRNIQGLGGHIHLSSQAGKGTTTRIVLPLTLAILDGMSVQSGSEVFILPLAHVSESLQPEADQIKRLSDTEKVLHVRGEYLPLVSLHDVFQIDGAETDPTKAIAVILDAEETRFALVVDQLVGQQQVVVKNLEANYRKVPGISAATILGDGSVALIVDVFALLRMTRKTAAVI